MWSVSLLLFLWVFAEGHAWHLVLVGQHPLRDIALQWKSYGPMVGTFNLMVYGSLGFLGCLLARDSRVAYSNTAFALLFIGLLNSFTNFGHHTYHLPQSHLVKWVSCIVSLLEAIFVAKFLIDIIAHLRGRARRAADAAVRFILLMTMTWSFVHVGLAVAISIPPVNTLIHGTQFVMAHAMGSMLGIDSMALWAVLLFVIQRMLPSEHRLARPRWVFPAFTLLNVVMLALVGLIAWKGAVAGYLRYMGPAAPAEPLLFALFPQLFMLLGTGLAAVMLWVNVDWTLSLVPVLRGQPAGRPGRGRPPVDRSAVAGSPPAVEEGYAVTTPTTRWPGPRGCRYPGRAASAAGTSPGG